MAMRERVRSTCAVSGNIANLQCSSWLQFLSSLSLTRRVSPIRCRTARRCAAVRNPLSGGNPWRGVVVEPPDGKHMSRESVLQVQELDQTTRLGPSGFPIEVSLRGVSPQGDAAETFSVVNGRATWESKLDSGTAIVSTPAFYLTAGGTRLASQQLLLEVLLAAPGRSISLLPSGRAYAQRLKETIVVGGTGKQTVVAWSSTELRIHRRRYGRRWMVSSSARSASLRSCRLVTSQRWTCLGKRRRMRSRCTARRSLHVCSISRPPARWPSSTFGRS